MAEDVPSIDTPDALLAELGKRLAAVEAELGRLMAEYERHMVEDCGSLAIDLREQKSAWRSFTAALGEADDKRLVDLVRRINHRGGVA